ncbi:MAG TPA: hypothetical protein VNL98_07325 [Gemmatimonadales bacterium]|nr:hypothetical protein [Gemmatimonadales bacterium]
MPQPLDEAQAEIVAVGYFRDLGYDYAFGPDIAPDGARNEGGWPALALTHTHTHTHNGEGPPKSNEAWPVQHRHHQAARARGERWRERER